MDVRVDEVTGIRFVREPYPFPSFAGRESLTVQVLGPDRNTVLYCYVHDLYDGQRMRPEKLDIWRALRERYGNLAPSSPGLDQGRADQAVERHQAGQFFDGHSRCPGGAAGQHHVAGLRRGVPD